jgi:UDP-N-acetylmuramoylalanine--D-glutamate ligase
MTRSAADVAGLTSWYADWAGLRVAVLGLGVSGFSVADTLAELGSELLVLSSTADPQLAGLLDVIGVRLATADLEEELDGFGADLVVVSPGFRPTHPLVVAAVEAGVPVWGDVELAWRVRDKVQPVAEWIAITGTNGKTTTTQLTTEMLRAGGRRAIACGNVGIPVLDAVRDPTGFDVLVVELSSFQLHYLDSMSAWAAACLNLADDHLDWHGSAAAYRAAKAKVYERAKAACVYNLDDEATREMVEQAEVIDGCRAIGFGLGVPGPSDVGMVDEILVDRAFLADRQRSALEFATVRDLEPVGLGTPHMVANVLAAAALARSFEVSTASIRSAVAGFSLGKHRTETVAMAAGVRWVDDSKATNPHAAQAAIDSFESIVWIVGGLLKGVDIDELVSRNTTGIRAVVVIGTDRKPLVEAFARHAPELPLFEVATTDTKEVMPTAVRLSAEVARSGDTVLLAPAAASMDQFIDYADRGDRFADAVHELLGGPDDDQHSATPPAA